MPVAQSAVVHDIPAAEVHVHNLRAAGILRHVSRHGVCCYMYRSADSSVAAHHISNLAGMRRAGACFRSLSDAAAAHRSLGGSPGAGWGGRCVLVGLRAGACCNLGAQRRCVVGVEPLRGGFGTSFAQPGWYINTILDSFKARTHTCSGSACIGSLSGLKPLLYAMVVGLVL